MKKALIIGSEGQDGKLLTLLLNKKGYKVWGLGRAENSSGFAQLEGYICFDLSNDNYERLVEFYRLHQPDETYYIAAYHHSSQEEEREQSLNFVDKSISVNQAGFIKVLEIINLYSRRTKVFYASSSLIFSGSNNLVQTEETKREPRCIYSISKSAAMDAAVFYRLTYNLFVSIGILYNHESIFRNRNYLSAKIISETKMLLEQKISSITIGDLSSESDWGYAPDYVEAMWHILQLKDSDSYIISSGNLHSVQNWFEILFSYLDIDWKRYVKEDKGMIKRKKTVLRGSNEKLRATGWSPKTSFEEMVVKLYQNTI